MDKKALIAVGLSLVIWVAWQKVYLEPIQAQQQAYEAAKRQAEEQAAATAAPGAVVDSLSKAATTAKGAFNAFSDKKAAPAPAPVKMATLENGFSKVTLSNDSFAVNGWELNSFSKSLDHQDDKISLEYVSGFSPQLRVHFSESPALSKVAGEPWTSFEAKGARVGESHLDSPELKAVRTFTLDEQGYGAILRYTFHFNGAVPKFIYLDLFGSPHRANDKEGSMLGQAPDKVMITFRDLNGRTSQMAAQLKEPKMLDASVRWLGLDTRYFVMALVPERDTGTDLGVQMAADGVAQAAAVRGSIIFPTNGKSEVTIGTKIFFGPKDMSALTKVDPLLSDAINFGWTSVIAIPLLQGLKWLYSYVKNYGLAIILLTFLIKMALFPLMYKSMTSMAKMSKLQPQLNALREKYKDDKEKLNVEMMNFMKANGYNPVGGCLPILFQMPIFFALYRVLFNSMELYQAPFAGWIHDLSSPDPFYVTPVLLCGLMYLQQKLSPNTAADPAQQKMLQIMPVMFGAFMLMLPSGLTIYMVVNSGVSIAQQYFLNRKLGIVRAKPVVVA